MTMEFDFSVLGCGTMYHVAPITALARSWLQTKIPSPEKRGAGMLIDSRTICEMMRAARRDGFNVELNDQTYV